MKKYIYLIYAACLYISSVSPIRAENITPHDIESDTPSTRQLTTVKQLLDEIETVQKQLNVLTSTGRLSSSVALTASGVLATFAYGAFYIANHIYWKDFEYDTIKESIIAGLFNSIMPALGVGGLISFSNNVNEKLPPLSYKDSVNVGYQTLITGLGLSLIFSSPSLLVKSIS